MEHGKPVTYKNGCRCEVCVQAKRERDREYYLRTREARKVKAAEWRAENRDKKAATDKAYREANADRLREQQREYYRDDPDKAKDRVKAWREANPEMRSANDAKYRERHREELREKSLAYYHDQMANGPEQVRARRRAWAKSPRGVMYNRLARHARRGSPTDEEAAEILYREPCAYCGGPGGEIDHIVPLSKGGTGDWSNLASACRTCNAQKGDQSLEEFLARKAPNGNQG